MLKYKNIYNKITKILVGIALSLASVSCITPGRVNYLQDMTHGSQIEIENRFEAAIAPYDELSITVSTSSTKDELASPFNLGNTAYSNAAYSKWGNYLVDVNGNIDMPIIGKLRVEGMTRLQLQDTLTHMLERGGYVEDPYVMVRFNNFKIFFLGGGKGRVLDIHNERCTFLEAIAMLGDLDLHVKRDNIAVMREVDGKMVMRHLDPRSSDVFNDPFFMLQQNDFIIADTYNGSILRTEFSYWYGMIGMLMSTASFIVSLAILKNK